MKIKGNQQEGSIQLENGALEMMQDMVKKDKLFYLLWGLNKGEDVKLSKSQPRKIEEGEGGHESDNEIPNNVFNDLLLKKFSTFGEAQVEMEKSDEKNDSDDELSVSPTKKESSLFEFILSEVKNESDVSYPSTDYLRKDSDIYFNHVNSRRIRRQEELKQLRMRKALAFEVSRYYGDVLVFMLIFDYRWK